MILVKMKIEEEVFMIHFLRLDGIISRDEEKPRRHVEMRL